MITPWFSAACIIAVYALLCVLCLGRGRKLGEIGQHDCVLAYASQGGQGQYLAQQLQQTLRQQGFNPALCTLNQLQAELLNGDLPLVMIASTYGAGEAPDNGRLFVKNSASLNFKGEYALLALGDRAYADYCAFGLQVHQRLEQLGARARFAPVCVDNLHGESLQSFQQQVLSWLAPGACLDDHQSFFMRESEPRHSVRLVARQCLNPQSAGKPMFAISLASEQPLSWQAGDVLCLHLGQDIEREYSIASVPQEQTLQLLVREQRYSDGSLGLGSGVLCHHAAFDEPLIISLRSHPAFHGPSAATPLILIGNGTGLAGLRAHLKAREGQSGINWLLYGERHPQHDQPYQQCLQQWCDSGHLARLDLTFSRVDNTQLPNATATRHYHSGYVQQALRAQAARLIDWVAQGAAIYLCGSREGMGQDVEQALLDILGEARVNQMIEQGLYRRDLY